MSEKKVVSRTVAIALGIVCIILVVGLVGAVAYITTKDSQITSLNSQISNLNDVVNLAKSTVWVTSQTISQPADQYYSWTNRASYAGYLLVNVQSSASTNTYAEVIYFSSKGVNYDQRIL